MTRTLDEELGELRHAVDEVKRAVWKELEPALVSLLASLEARPVLWSAIVGSVVLFGWFVYSVVDTWMT